MANKKNVSETDTIIAANAKEGTQAAAPRNKARHEGATIFAYIGPALPGGKLKSNTIMSGTYAEIMDYYKDIISEFPGIERLIIPVSQLAESREKARKSGNTINNHCAEIVAAIKAKGEKQ